MNTKKKAFDAACDYLGVSERTTAEVRNKLKEKGYEQNETDEAIEKLVQLKFLDDAGFTKRYIEFATEKGRGMKRIREELRRKGIDSFTIEDALFELQDEGILTENNGKEMALEIALDTVRGHEDEIDEKLVAKVARKLQSRGFESDEIYYAVSKVRRLKNESV